MQQIHGAPTMCQDGEEHSKIPALEDPSFGEWGGSNTK